MWFVMDWNMTKLYGPFNTKDGAEEWLAGQGIYVGMYDSQEVSIITALDPSLSKLEVI